MTFRKLEAFKDAVLDSALMSPMTWVLVAFMACHIPFVYNVLHVRKGIYVAHDIQKECPESGMIMERDTTRYQLYMLFKSLNTKKPHHDAFTAFWVIAIVVILCSAIYVIRMNKTQNADWSWAFLILCLSFIAVLVFTKSIMYTVVGMADGKRTRLAHMTDQIQDFYEKKVLANMPKGTDISIINSMPPAFEKDIMHRWLLVNPSSRDTKPLEWGKLPDDEKMGYFVPATDNKWAGKVAAADDADGKAVAAKLKQLFESLNTIRNPNLYNEIRGLKEVCRALEFLTVFPMIVAAIGLLLHKEGWMPL